VNQKTVIYFFCRNADPDKRNTRSVIATLLSQVLGIAAGTLDLNALSKIAERASIMYDSYQNVRMVSVDTLWNTLRVLLEVVPGITCVVDALDECDQGTEERKFLAEKLLELSMSALDIQIIVTSRELEDIRLLGRMNLTEISIQTEDIQHDILAVIEEGVSGSSKLAKLREHVVPAVMRGSDGMFLWAKLMLASLETSTTPRSLLAKLERMPIGLVSIYNRILYETGLNCTDEELQLRQRILSWTIVSYRAFRLDELCVALSVVPGTEELAEGDLILDLRRDIQKLCGPLIYISEQDEVRLVHLCQGGAFKNHG
jgi:hypothetical protein